MAFAPEPTPPKKRNPNEEVSRLVGMVFALVVGLLLAIAVGSPLSMRGWLGIGIAVALVGGLLAWGPRGRWLIGLAIAAAIGGSAVLLAAPPQRDDPFLDAITLPADEPAPRYGRLIAERDVALIGFRAMRLTGGVRADELEGFARPLAGLYAELDDDDPLRPATQIDTALGRQTAARFDAFVASEGDGARWLVFLHGYGGSFAAFCWVVAQGAAEAGWSTICPATSIAGNWHRGEGPEIARAAMEYARSRGAEHFVLAGLSNGGVGASFLASELEDELEGLILISGLDDSAPPTALPTLVIHGDGDARFSATRAQAYAEGLPHGELLMLDHADHFLLVKHRGDVSRAITRFVSERQ